VKCRPAVLSFPALLPVLLPVFASTPWTAAELPEFEVASIKPTDMSGDIKVGTLVSPGGKVRILGCELKGLIRVAFRLTYQRVSGAPAWAEEVKYDVEALPPKAAAIQDFRFGAWDISDERLRQMLQSLLIDRFRLQFHWTTKMADVYVLKRGGKQPAFHPAGAGAPSAGRVRLVWSKRQFALEAATMQELADFLSGVLGGPVLDRTGLRGRFDYTPKSADPDAPDPTVDLTSSALSFLQDLHLKLERTKGPVEVFVVDHVEKPSPN
jgi:uncharacterized protein (TIGR03435 family)